MNEKIKILSWNINGLRCQKSNFKQFLDDLQAHIICFQETKITRDQLEESLALVDGYVSFFSFSRKRSGYSGVATYCKKEAAPSFAQEGLSGILNIGSLNKECGTQDVLSDVWDSKDLKDLDAEGRCIITQHPFTNENGETQLLSVINVYCPRADPEKPERATFKLSFYKLLKERASALRNSGSGVIILGDLNTSHKRIDHCDPCDDEEFEKRDDRVFLDHFLLDVSKMDADKGGGEDVTGGKIEIGSSDIFSADENEDHAEECCNSFQVIDTFRYFHPNKQEGFTCWNTKVNARSTNYGTRIDYILCDESFLDHVNDSFIHPDIHGSDHCPVSIDLSRVTFLPIHSIPTISTKFYPEFHGSQQKLSSYFKPNSHVKEMKQNTVEERNFTCKDIVSSKRKLSDTHSVTKNKKGGFKQSTISSFFIKTSEDLSSPSKSVSSSPITGSSCSDSVSSSPVTVSGCSDSCEDSLEGEVCVKFSGKSVEIAEDSVKSTHCNKASGWSFLMKTPAPPPLCSGHKEPSVLRTVKKKGPTLNKQFYSCARGIGKEGDPNSRCNFFKWFTHGR